MDQLGYQHGNRRCENITQDSVIIEVNLSCHIKLPVSVVFIVGRSPLEGLWPAFDYKMNAGAVQEFSGVMKDPLAGTGIFSRQKNDEIRNSCYHEFVRPGMRAARHRCL
jgi:hypothetical protein